MRTRNMLPLFLLIFAMETPPTRAADVEEQTTTAALTAVRQTASAICVQRDDGLGWELSEDTLSKLSKLAKQLDHLGFHNSERLDPDWSRIIRYILLGKKKNNIIKDRTECENKLFDMLTDFSTVPVLPATPIDPNTQPPVLAISDIDMALKKLIQGNVAFNAPDRATIGKSQIVETRLSVTKTPNALIAELSGAGKTDSAPLLVSDKMVAMLNGAGAFEISPSGPQTQLISRIDTTTWTWTITPKQAGSQFLLLSFDAIISINGKEGTRTINTLRRKIEVEVGWPETFSDWLEYGKKLFTELTWLWVSILIPMAAYAVRFSQRRRKPKGPKPNVHES
jgi:hypothetical protein